MATFSIKEVGYVRGRHDVPEDDGWGLSRARIVLDPERFTADALIGLDAFSHAEIVFVLDRAGQDEVQLPGSSAFIEQQ